MKNSSGCIYPVTVRNGSSYTLYRFDKVRAKVAALITNLITPPLLYQMLFVNMSARAI